MDSQWNLGEEIQITASKTAEGTKTVTTIIQGIGGQTVNVTLAETSDVTIAETDSTKRHNLYFALPVHYDEEKVTRLRPFPVQTEAPLDKYRASDTKIDGKIRYYGFLDRLGNWYVRRDDLTDSNNRTYRYAKGTKNYPTTLALMQAETYDFFNNVF
ncbi:hypothetical protein LCGC14_2128030 [marine sediment metagenome]|uniref:Uncharacterized protein n=1 Tax=marine sediment metagenome TaxID=412755 RepID=A0A0F9GYE6_9ZZZZ